MCGANMEQILRCLKVGGVVQIATDHADYFEQIKDVISANSRRVEAVEFTRAAEAQDGEITGTNYERKYIKDKRKIYTIAAKKIL